MTLFSAVTQAPPDAILGLTEQFHADPRPSKANLGVGVYQDATGKLPLLRCVAAAERRLAEQPKAKGYLPIDGMPAYTGHVRELVFGSGSPVLADGRVVTVQALGFASPQEGLERYRPLQDDIASTAWWYQREPHAPFPPAPSFDRMDTA